MGRAISIAVNQRRGLVLSSMVTWETARLQPSVNRPNVIVIV